MATREQLWFLLVLLLTGACAGHREERETLNVEHAALLEGEDSPPSDDAIVQLKVADYGGWCNGVLIAPNVVVTALLCVSGFMNDVGGAICNDDGTAAPNSGRSTIGPPLKDPGDVEVFFGNKPSSGLDPRPQPQAFGAEIFGTGSTTICSDDVAVLVLDRDLPSNGLPVRVNRPVVAGEELTLIGYDLIPPSFLRTRRSHVPVLAVGPDDLSEGPGELIPRTFLIGDGPCEGEQGAPAISEETGAVVGIFSFVTTGSSWRCEPGLRNIYTKIAPYSGLLEQALESTGRKLRVEGEANDGVAPPDEGGCSFVRARPGVPSSHRSTGFVLALALACFRARRRKRPKSS